VAPVSLDCGFSPVKGATTVKAAVSTALLRRWQHLTKAPETVENGFLAQGRPEHRAKAAVLMRVYVYKSSFARAHLDITTFAGIATRQILGRAPHRTLDGWHGYGPGVPNPGLSGTAEGVAQISNLLYRRIAFCRPPNWPRARHGWRRSRLEICDTAGWKPALPLTPWLAR
jgi:hypothetical protein